MKRRDSFYEQFFSSCCLQISLTDDDDSKSAKSAVAAGGFTILSEKKLFLGQKVGDNISHRILFLLCEQSIGLWVVEFPVYFSSLAV